MQKESVLLYRINEEKIRQIKMLLLRMKVKIKVVEKKDYLQPLGLLAGGKEFTKAEEYAGEELTEEMMVMVGFSNQRMNELLMAFRKMGIERISLKAVLTPTNQHWNGLDLFHELRKERSQIEYAMAKRKEQENN